jgi:hypothetical protein
MRDEVDTSGHDCGKESAGAVTPLCSQPLPMNLVPQTFNVKRALPPVETGLFLLQVQNFRYECLPEERAAPALGGLKPAFLGAP